ncbi:hypothetical protein C8J56DRAFT_1061150 [Mycena floridula]|nr:hypothetical protein C8J56DRAFT_1061150 [Mycena floridula]
MSISQCTIRFMSSRLLDNLNKRPELQDDLEAFVHVMLYVSFCYLKTDSTQNQLLYFLDRLYNDTTSSKNKRWFLDCPQFCGKDINFIDSPSMTRWIKRACALADGWIKYCRGRTVKPEDIAFNVGFQSHEAMLRLWDKALCEVLHDPREDQAFDYAELQLMYNACSKPGSCLCDQPTEIEELVEGKDVIQVNSKRQLEGASIADKENSDPATMKSEVASPRHSKRVKHEK